MRLAKKADAVIIVAFLMLAAVVFCALIAPDEGAYIKVTHDGVCDVYPANEKREIELASNGTHLTVIIDDGVYVKDADCPDKICQNTGKIKNGSIVCLPAHVMIEFVRNNGENDAYAG